MRENRLAKILDEVIDGANRGEPVDLYLSGCSDAGPQIAPLLQTAMVFATTPDVIPNGQFVTELERRLSWTARLRENQARSQMPEQSRSGQFISWPDFPALFAGAKRVAIPAVLALLMMVGASLGVLRMASPAPALASPVTLSVLSGAVSVQSPGSDGWHNTDSSLPLTAGTRIKTSSGSNALLTFFEGSTIKMEANTEIEVQQAENVNDRSTAIILRQWSGKTWSSVEKMTDSASRYQIVTPSAVASVHGTLFATEVDGSGTTRIATTQGVVSVASENKQVNLSASQQTEVEMGAAPSEPAKMTASPSEIIINTDYPATISVKDPSGAATGFLPDGLVFNQISGSYSSLAPGGEQTITVPRLISGEYLVALRYIKDGKASFNIQGKSGDYNAFAYAGTLDSGQTGWLIHLTLQVKDGLITGTAVGNMEPLTDKGPEKLVAVKAARHEFISNAPAPASTGPAVQEVPPGKSESKDTTLIDNKPNTDKDAARNETANQGKEAPAKASEQEKGQAQAQGQNQAQAQSNAQKPEQDLGKGQPPAQSQDANQKQGQSQSQEQNQGQSRQGDGKGQGSGQGQGSGSGQSSGQGQSSSSGQSSGQGQSSSSGQSSGQGQSSSSGQSSGQGQSSSSGQSSGSGQGSGQGQSSSSGQSSGQGQSSSSGQSSGQGQSSSSGQSSGQGQSSSSGQSSGSGQGSGQGQSSSSGQSSGQGQSSGSGQGSGQGQSSSSGQSSGQGQSSSSGQSSGQGQGQAKGSK